MVILARVGPILGPERPGALYVPVFKDVVKFLSTKDKLREGLSVSDRLHILVQIDQIKKVAEEYERLLGTVEDNIVEIQMESRTKTA